MPYHSPIVSVIIPTYNRNHVLSRALESVLTQTYQNFEIIVVDDGSEEPTVTEEVLNKLGDKRIRYFRHAQNRGGSAARNTGIQKSNGYYIAFLDSDDEWLPQKLEKQVQLIQNGDSQLGVVYTRTWRSQKKRLVLGRMPEATGYIYEKELYGDHVTETSTWLVKRLCFEHVGGFNESMPARQDYEMTLRISQYFHYQFVSEPLVILHVDGGNQITRNLRNRLAGSLRIISIIEKKIESKPWLTKRQIIARHLYAVGRFCYKSDERLGTNYLLAAVKMYPLSLKYWLIFGATFGGSQVFSFVTKGLSKQRKKFGLKPSV